MQDAVPFQALYRGDLAIRGLYRQENAAIERQAIDQHSAGAALSRFADALGAGQTMESKRVEKGLIRGNVPRLPPSVYSYVDIHAATPFSSTPIARMMARRARTPLIRRR